MLSLDDFAFEEGGHYMANKDCDLPKGSYRKQHKGYEEVFVPPPKRKEPKATEIIKISALPKWSQPAFEVL